MPFRDRDLGSRRRVAVHVVDVATQRWIGVVNERMLQLTRRAVYFDRGMCAVLLELARAAADEPQFRIGIKPAMLDPSAKEEILARGKESDVFSRRCQGMS